MPGQTALAYSVDFGTASTYVPLAAGNVRLSATRRTRPRCWWPPMPRLSPGRQYTAVVTNVAASLQETIYADQTTPAPAGEVAVRVIDAATRAGSVDLYMVPAGGRLTATAAMRAGVRLRRFDGIHAGAGGNVLAGGGARRNGADEPGAAADDGTADELCRGRSANRRAGGSSEPLQSHEAPGIDEIVASDYDPPRADVKVEPARTQRANAKLRFPKKNIVFETSSQLRELMRVSTPPYTAAA